MEEWKNNNQEELSEDTDSENSHPLQMDGSKSLSKPDTFLSFFFQ
jgi:hypothetical protein